MTKKNVFLFDISKNFTFQKCLHQKLLAFKVPSFLGYLGLSSCIIFKVTKTIQLLCIQILYLIRSGDTNQMFP